MRSLAVRVALLGVVVVALVVGLVPAAQALTLPAQSHGLRYVYSMSVHVNRTQGARRYSTTASMSAVLPGKPMPSLASPNGYLSNGQCVSDGGLAASVCETFDYYQKTCNSAGIVGGEPCANVYEDEVMYKNDNGAGVSLTSGSFVQGAAGNNYTKGGTTNATHSFGTITSPTSGHDYTHAGAWSGQYICINSTIECFQGGHATLNWYLHGHKQPALTVSYNIPK